MSREPKMDRKEFEFLAAILRDSRKYFQDQESFERFVNFFSQELRITNDNYDQYRFLQAVIVKPVIEAL